jgi:CheY-like chemotaxis protein
VLIVSVSGAGCHRVREIILLNAKITASLGQPRVVLLVEDESSVRWPLAEYLRQAGWAVIEACDAAEAMQVIDSGATVDIGFVDFRLRGGPTGYMFARWLARVRPTVPVLLTSGLTSRAPGFVEGERRAYIAKPYAFSEVSRILVEMSKSVGAEQKPVRALIVDDNVDAAVALSLLLQLGGHTTALAYEGIEALRAVAEFKPDIVLLNLGLPGMDGYELARTIRRQPELDNPLLVAVTGSNAPEDRLRTAQAGFDEHLTKPVEISTIELLLMNLPERRAGGGNASIAKAHTDDLPQ